MSVALLPAALLWIAAIALAVALAVRGAIPRGRVRPVRAKVLARALLPNRILRSRSGRMDIASFLLSALLAGTMLGWALVSGTWWSAGVERALASAPALPFAVSPNAAAIVMTALLFLAYEGAYWLNHWLSHRVGLLWAFHKMHHSAASLSPLTNFRVHPVDTIVFYNMAAAIEGVTAGILKHLMGTGAAEISIGGTNLLIFLGAMILSHLQHTHLWLATTGRWGRWLLSPAHHQLHHSTDPRHHNRNLGSSLALFDRLAGTLLVPAAQRQPLRFGVDGAACDPHGFRGALVQPFVEATRVLLPTPATETGPAGRIVAPARALRAPVR